MPAGFGLVGRIEAWVSGQVRTDDRLTHGQAIEALADL
jgi:hypothetical protein